MDGLDTTHLAECLSRHREQVPGLAAVPMPSGNDTPDTLIERYECCYPLLERAMWSGYGDFHTLLDSYQALFREQDTLIRQHAAASGAPDPRHHFILAIPVADRPAHLRACLESIRQVCECYGYGGRENGVYPRIRIIVAEDSRDPGNIRQHQALVEEYRARGLRVTHFGQDEQYRLLDALPERLRAQLGNILTTQPRERFYLKGQAANRNLCYLKFLQLTEDPERTLYYLVDSDQNFCVSRRNGNGEEVVHALNYFHYIDKAFRNSDTLLLTGKLVGDPPVSPAVMAANFLDDIDAFFAELARKDPGQACGFHGRLPQAAASGAIYHDMANLFGFDKAAPHFPYPCPLRGEHDHIACLRGLAARLPAFFFGEHLTRKTFFSYGDGFESLAGARTIYPGNYVARHAGLKYIIPFGHLRLRMSGPTAGRLIAAEIGERFAAINLPHLHRRTTDSGLDKDFRPGVEREQAASEERIDLSNEFERQFFGDLMLFTSETLARETDITAPLDEGQVERALEERERELLALYRQKHEAILARARALEDRVFRQKHWWLERPELADALRQVRAFLDNVRHNFGEASSAWQLIRSDRHRAGRRRQIRAALLDYRRERDAWDSLFQ